MLQNNSSQLSLTRHSQALKDKIIEKIKQQNSISFAEYMNMCLYEPGLGYYSSGTHKFGKEGDFITSPELGDLFAKSLAVQFRQIIESLISPVIMELGAGTGQFCFDCLTELDNLNSLPEKYYILEVSADLQHRQKQKIKSLPKHLSQLVCWISEPLKDDFEGVIFANEVIDALPVEVFKYSNNQYQQMRVDYKDDFKTLWSEFPQNLYEQLHAKELDLPESYVSEFIPNLSSWLNTISQNLKKGVVLFVDYGYERDAYYHLQRNKGTLVCHHRHKANFNYFENIGLQDITAFVDFTAVAEAADDCGLDVDGYTTQAYFLMSLGIQNLLGDSDDNYSKYYEKTTELKKLTLPSEMGEKFKVIGLSRNFSQELNGFAMMNLLHLL
jgi:SAM-dependent MidA family methyltransferase